MDSKIRHCLCSISLVAAAFAAGAGALFTAASDAQAALKLELSDSSTTVTVTDNNPGDHSSTSGKISYSGSIGIFGINLSTGYSKPVLGSATEPELQLNSLDVSSSFKGGTLTIKLSDTGFTTTGATHWISSISGATSGSVGFSAYITESDGSSTNVANLDGLNGLFSESDFKTIDFGSDTASLSVTLVATITHGRGFGATALVANVKDPVPGQPPMRVSEPATLALFGAGLLGLGLLMRLFGGRARRSGSTA
jgi:hypothetical protein